MKRSFIVPSFLSFLLIGILVTNIVLITLSPPTLATVGNVASPHGLMVMDAIHQDGAPPEVSKQTSVWDILRRSGVGPEELEKHKHELPSIETIEEQFGSEPVIVGLESCASFRQSVPEERRMLGAAGMFSTGTNLVTQLLKQNCVIPARREKFGAAATKEQLGMRWQVPWGKHTPAHFKWNHATEKAAAINKADVLPVITIRNPWRWMQSMCKNPYAARWPHHSQCPNLKKSESNKDDSGWNEISVKYGAATESYMSLAHLWNEWYREYLQARVVNNEVQEGDETKPSFPWVAIRIEDLVFHTVPTIKAVCECAGGVLAKKFRYITQSAKADSPGHDTTTGILQAWIKYSKPLQKGAGFSKDDYGAALEALDEEILGLFRYQNPPPIV